MSLSLNDKDAFDEITRNLPRDIGLDVLLHSPGGSAEATESIGELLRARFNSVRFIVPSLAKSAATMLAMLADQIVIDEVGELGPTDPQLQIVRDNRVISAPAQAIKDQFKVAKDEINGDPSKLPGWVPILREYGPSLLAECDNHLALAEDLVCNWLERYMFSGDADRAAKARHAAQYLANHNNFRSHARRVGIADLQNLQLNILDMRTQPDLHNAVRELYAAIMVTFEGTLAFKIVENNQNEAVIGAIQVQIQPQSGNAGQPQPTPPPLNPVPNSQGSRKTRPQKKRR